MYILLACTDSNGVLNFRRELIVFLRKKGFSVGVIVSDNKRKEEIKNLGIDYFYLPFKNRGKNPFSMWKVKKKYETIFQKVRPEIVFSFQLKPNILAPLAARKAGITEVFSMVEGLGDPFQSVTMSQKIVKKVVCILYKHSLKSAKKVFFLNDDDMRIFESLHLVNKNKMFRIPGIGINTKEYSASKGIPKEKIVLCLSRLLVNKGILDFCDIARQVTQKRKDIKFWLYGEESQLKVSDIQSYIKDGSIFYGGYCKKPIEPMLKCRILVSTSYREGFPRVILEAMALGKPVIATNVVGNNDAVIDGVTGFLVSKGNFDEFANKIISIIDDDQLLEKLGQSARKTCVENYDSESVNALILGNVSNN